MKNYENYVLGSWIKGDGDFTPLYNAVNGDEIGFASSKGLDFNEVMNYARKIGGFNLRKMTFQERGIMLKKLALHLHSKKDMFYPISYLTGATKIDSWIDIEGGIGNLFANASLRRQFPDLPFHVEGNAAGLSKNGSFIGHHIMVPKQGVAIHINAFNFPIWGMLEKIAVNLMAGMPAIIKPATITSYLTNVMFEEIINSKILPEGSLQLICGSARGILDGINSEDVITFTGSASTGKKLKSHPKIVENAVPTILSIRSGKQNRIPNSDFYIINYELLHKRQVDLARLKIRTLVCDEVQHLRSKTTQKYKAIKTLASVKSVKYRVGLSGTPIYNHGSEIWPIVDILKPGLLGNFKEFCEYFCYQDERGKVGQPSKNH